ncbi:MAG: DUF2281 domain-containing protein [Saprospiraceae bacterium]
MSAMTLYSKIEMLPEHLQQQVLDYVELLLSQQGRPEKPRSTRKAAGKNNPKSRFAGRISPATTAQLHQQLKEMRDEWQ